MQRTKQRQDTRHTKRCEIGKGKEVEAITKHKSIQYQSATHFFLLIPAILLPPFAGLASSPPLPRLNIAPPPDGLVGKDGGREKPVEGAPNIPPGAAPAVAPKTNGVPPGVDGCWLNEKPPAPPKGEATAAGAAPNIACETGAAGVPNANGEGAAAGAAGVPNGFEEAEGIENGDGAVEAGVPKLKAPPTGGVGAGEFRFDPKGLEVEVGAAPKSELVGGAVEAEPNIFVVALAGAPKVKGAGTADVVENIFNETGGAPKGFDGAAETAVDTVSSSMPLSSSGSSMAGVAPNPPNPEGAVVAEPKVKGEASRLNTGGGAKLKAGDCKGVVADTGGCPKTEFVGAEVMVKEGVAVEIGSAAFGA